MRHAGIISWVVWTAVGVLLFIVLLTFLVECEGKGNDIRIESHALAT